MRDDSKTVPTEKEIEAFIDKVLLEHPLPLPIGGEGYWIRLDTSMKALYDKHYERFKDESK